MSNDIPNDTSAKPVAETEKQGHNEKPREWVIDGSAVYDHIEGPFVEEPTPVIEKSAYDKIAKELGNLKASMLSWEVAKELEIYANSDKNWNGLMAERDMFRNDRDTVMTKLQVACVERDKARTKYDELVSYMPKVPTEPYEKQLAKEANELSTLALALVQSMKEAINHCGWARAQDQLCNAHNCSLMAQTTLEVALERAKKVLGDV